MTSASLPDPACDASGARQAMNMSGRTSKAPLSAQPQEIAQAVVWRWRRKASYVTVSASSPMAARR